MKMFARLLLRLGIILFLGILSVVLVNLYVIFSVDKYISEDLNDLPKAQVALVLGAKVLENGVLSDVLKDRSLKALELYNEGKVDKILVSGDNGMAEYDEVGPVKDFLLKNEVKENDIVLDHAGFDTYDSVYRAAHIFGVESVIVVTQEFHLSRAVYIARANGMDAYGYVADRQPYVNIVYYRIREIAARAKSFLDVFVNAQPKYLGDPISITGR